MNDITGIVRNLLWKSHIIANNNEYHKLYISYETTTKFKRLNFNTGDDDDFAFNYRKSKWDIYHFRDPTYCKLPKNY